jgi:hypothetical protein
MFDTGGVTLLVIDKQHGRGEGHLLVVSKIDVRFWDNDPWWTLFFLVGL